MKGELKGKLITLKMLRESFFSQYLKMFSLRVRDLLHVSLKESEIDYLKDRLEKQQMGKTLFYCIFENKEKQLIGAIEIRDQEEFDGQLYSWLNEHYWGTGVYQEALALVSKEYFIQTEDPFFSANVDAANMRSYKALKKHGFIDVGVAKGPYGKRYKLILRRR